ncbi:MAG: SCO family protein [Caldilineaceae bacterium]
MKFFRFVTIGTIGRRAVQIGLALLLILTIAACRKEHEFYGIAYNPPIAAPALNGIRENGSTFHIEDAQGKLTLLYFGYTQCPDVCPLTMAQIASIYRDMGDDAQNMRVIFVSTDPERDTPAQLTDYLSRFDTSFWGVQIPLSDLAATMKAYGGLAEKDPLAKGKAPDQYTVTHSDWIYAIDKEGNLRLLFSMQLQPPQIKEDLQALLAE